MIKAYFSGKSLKSTIGVIVLALLVGGISAQASGVLNSPSGGYLVCVDSKTKLITHPGTSSCPKGSKRLVIGAAGKDGAIGLTGAAGLNGVDGKDGKDGKTLWSGVKDPESTWGAPGDMFINSVTKTLFGPKNIDGTWPVGVSMIGPKGEQGLTGAQGPQGPVGGSGPAGPAGNNATNAITELFVCDGPDAGTVADEKCKIGMTGPGGGIIFFVDYNDQYVGFNYLEAAPKPCEGRRGWSSDGTNSLVAVNDWAARAVGSGQSNTTAMLTNGATSYLADTREAAFYANALANGVPTGCLTSKDDWFLGSIGEMMLMYENLQGFGGFMEDYYWSSSASGGYGAWSQNFFIGVQSLEDKGNIYYVRPVRAF